MTKMRPRNAGNDPITRLAATIKPQTAIGPGFAATARIDVHTAASSPTSRSSNSGNDTTLMASTSKAKRKPTQQRQRFIVEGQPRQRDADERVDQAEENDVRPIRPEIIETSHQDVPEIGNLNPADCGQGGILALLTAPQGAT